MARKTESRVIDGMKVRVTQLEPLEAYPLSLRVGRVALPLVAADSNFSLPTATALLDAMAGDERLLVDLLRSADAEVDGRIVPLDSRETINAVFTGKLSAMLQAATFAAEVNFRDFFSAVLARLGAPSAADDESTSPST